MIRPVKVENDTPVITRIYNHYIVETTVTFETEPVTEEQMRQRISSISSNFPFFVYENGDGEVIGYCYVHSWKERAAYNSTLETTVYLKPEFESCGIGTLLMEKLISECRKCGFRVLIACVTEENSSSIAFHEKLGFKQVSHFEKVGCKFGRLLDVIDLQYNL